MSFLFVVTFKHGKWEVWEGKKRTGVLAGDLRKLMNGLCGMTVLVEGARERGG